MVREVTSWIKEKDAPSHIIGDVTARDGIQAVPWYHFPTKENRAQLARQMMQTGIPHIEVGFPVIEWDPETVAVRHVIERTRKLHGGIFTLARLTEADIKQCISVLEPAQNGGIHIFIGTSPFHREALGKSQEDILWDIPTRIAQVRSADLMCQFSAEDATRTEDDFLAKVYQVAEASGAQILNVPDTVGFTDPDEYARILWIVRGATQRAIISAHCHNDMDCAGSNALIAIRRGLVEKIEGTIFWLGERVWNTDLTSIIMTLMTHEKYAKKCKNIIKNKKWLAGLIELVQSMTGYIGRPVQAGYGFDAIVNRSGVHQAKVAEMKESYIWMDPNEFGLKGREYIDVWPLTGKAWVEFIFGKLGIQFEKKDLIVLTSLIRSIFSPDTNIHDIYSTFHELDESTVNKLANKVTSIRQEARMLIPTVQRQKEWRRKTNDIIRKAVDYFYRRYTD